MKTWKVQVEAETRAEARAQLRNLPDHAHVEEVPDQIYWPDKIEEMANDILDENWGEWVRDHGDLPDPETLYQQYVVEYSSEWLDTEFIYTDAAEAVEIISSLSEWEETDFGLWDGLEPEEALTAKAFWTARSALIDKVMTKIKRRVQEREWELIEEGEELCEEQP